MLLRRSLVAVIVIAAGIAISSRAADEKSPAADAPKEKPKATKLFKPWSDLTSLSDEQKGKIRDIHTKFLADRKALEDKQHDDIFALLSDDQKVELKKVETANKGGKKSADAPTDEKKD